LSIGGPAFGQAPELYGSIYEKSPAYNAAMTDWQTLAKASMSAPAAGAPGVAAILTPRGLGVGEEALNVTVVPPATPAPSSWSLP
jgi:hypothetical protein